MVAVLITGGSVATWVAVVGIAVVAWLQWRGGGATAIQVLRSTNEVLERRVHDQDRLIAERERAIAELRAKTDVATALEPVIAAFAEHERRAEERHAATLEALLAIAARLTTPGEGGAD